MEDLLKSTQQYSPQKLLILFRLEPGCLGPDGVDHIDTFCQLAERTLTHLNADVCQWFISPRFDKSLVEIQYSLAGKVLPRDKALKFVQSFEQSLDTLEERFEDKLTQLINQYIARKQAP
ncbi:hypothetical protein ACROAE_12195 [Shewanella sp. MF05960]|uniref:hypothetical protein n=1 Tax=Shewanella sp. MF05960 TaxID=3434874 RepID=UPI003D78BD1C